jgi:hypothetical protein
MHKVINCGTDGWKEDGDLQFPEKISISYNVFSFDPKATYKVLSIIEPRAVVDFFKKDHSNLYNLMNENPEYIEYVKKNFDLILTWEKNLLEILPNAQKFVYGECFLDLNDLQLNKQDKISFLTSNKTFTDGHIKRLEIFQTFKNISTINNFQYVQVCTPPMIPSKNVLFETYKFSIIIENSKYNDYFTEKLVDCLVSKTIPIYWGCPNVSEYFNPEGILSFDTIDDLIKILKDLALGFYESKIDVIEENYLKSLEYFPFFKRIEKVINDKFFNGDMNVINE